LAVVPSSTHHEDGVRVELSEPAATDAVGDDAVCVAHYGDGLVTALSVTSRAAPKAPPLWFAELTEPTAAPPAVSLVAFSGHRVTPGTLLDRAALGEVAVASRDQLAAVRWYPATGEVDQIYVSPAWRRRSIAGAIIMAAGTLSVARGWPRLWGDGQRTAMGERWRNAGPWAHRAATLSHLAPPMTPFDER
jgi:GNAT superfamily N-acetyltransferase